MTDTDTMTAEQAKARLAEMATAYHGTPPTEPPTTPAEAQARLATLAENKKWAADYLAGNIEARQEFASLTAMAAAADTRTESVLNGTAAPQAFELTSDENPLTTRELIGAVERLQEAGLGDDVIRQIVEGREVTIDERRQVEELQRRLHGNAEWRQRYLTGDHEAKRQAILIAAVLSANVKG